MFDWVNNLQEKIFYFVFIPKFSYVALNLKKKKNKKEKNYKLKCGDVTKRISYTLKYLCIENVKKHYIWYVILYFGYIIVIQKQWDLWIIYNFLLEKNCI